MTPPVKLFWPAKMLLAVRLPKVRVPVPLLISAVVPVPLTMLPRKVVLAGPLTVRLPGVAEEFVITPAVPARLATVTLEPLRSRVPVSLSTRAVVCSVVAELPRRRMPLLTVSAP